jgi:hypothetical protein
VSVPTGHHIVAPSVFVVRHPVSVRISVTLCEDATGTERLGSLPGVEARIRGSISLTSVTSSCTRVGSAFTAASPLVRCIVR